MTEPDLARSITRRLTEGLDGLAPSVCGRLEAAREAALLRARTPPTSARERVGADDTTAPRLGWWGPRLFAPALGLVVGLLAMLYWEQTREQPAPQIHAEQPAPIGSTQALPDMETAEVDADVLAEELPVTAYLDQGFEVWLYHAMPPAGQP